MTAKEYFDQFPDKRFTVSLPVKPEWANQEMVRVRFQYCTTMPAKGNKEMFDKQVKLFEDFMRHHCPLQCQKKLGVGGD